MDYLFYVYVVVAFIMITVFYAISKLIDDYFDKKKEERERQFAWDLNNHQYRQAKMLSRQVVYDINNHILAKRAEDRM